MSNQPITIQGRQKLGQELHELKMVERPQTVIEIDIARDHGDLKENAEYHAAREKLRFIEARMAELGDLYDNVREVDPSKFTHDKVMFGSTVTPLARQLMGKEEEDEVTVKLPSGEVDYEIVSICYKEIIFS